MATPTWYQWWKFRKPADYAPTAVGEARIGRPSRLEEATPWARSIADILGTAGRAVGDYLGGFEERRQRTIDPLPEPLRSVIEHPLPERLLEALRTTPENVAGLLSALAQTGQMRAREGPDWAEAVEQGRQWWRQAGEPQVLPDIYPVVPPGEVPEAYPVPGTEPILEKPVLPWKGFLETLPETPLYGGPVMGPARAAAAREATQAARAGARRLLAEEAGMVRVPRGKPFFEGMKPVDVWDGLGRAEKMRAAKAAELDPKVATKLWKDIGPEERAALEGLVPERVAPPEVPLPEAEAAPRAGLVEEAGRIPEGGVGIPTERQLPDLVRRGMFELEDQGKIQEYYLSSQAKREAIDKWLVEIKHPLAYEPGTPEARYLKIIKEELRKRQAERAVVPPEAPRLVPKLTEPPFAEALLPEQEVIPRPEVSDEVLREELGRQWRRQNEEFWARERARQEVPGEAPPPPPTEPPIVPPPGEGVPPTGGPGEPLFERGRQPTIAATERATTIEEKLAKQRATDESIFSPSQTLEEVANPQILQLQQTAPDVFQRLQETFQRLPVLRWIGQEIEPIGAAVARAKAGLPIALAVVKRALYVRTEQALALLETQIWRAGNKEILGLRNGVATKVRLNESAQALADAGMIPKESIGRLSDIIEHIEEYVLSPEQRRAIVQLQNTWNANIEALLKAGIDVNEVDRYFPRLVTKAPSGVEGVHTTAGALKARTFKSERAGIRAGYQYADPLEAMTTRLTDNVSLIANKRLMEQIRSLGEKPSERLKRTGAEALVSRKAAREAFAAARDEVKAAENEIINNQRAARRAKDPTRKAAYTEYAENARLRLEEAQTALEQAQTDLKQSAQVLRQAARKAAEPSLVKGEIKAAGRIFPKEVGQELQSYGLEKFLPDDPSLLDDFFATYRGSMVTGDWSQLFVQGNNLLWRDPLSWFKATAGSLEATLRNPDSWLLANADAIRSAIKAGAATAPEEFLLREGGKLSRALARLPLVKQTQRSFEWFTLLNQVERWKALKGMEKMGGELAQTASIVRKQSGVILRPGLTKGQLRVERYTFFAPRFLGSLVSLVTDAARPGVAGNEARKILASIFVGATAATTAGQLLATGDLPNFTDPDADGWFSIRFKTGETVNLYGPLYPYFRAMAQFGKRMVEGNYDKAAEALTFLARGRVSATIGPFIDFMTGRGFSGRIERSPLGFFLAYLERVGPIGPRQIANHIRKVWEERAQPFPWLAGEMAGLRTTDQSTIDRFDYIARQATGDKITRWQDLPAAQRLQLESSPEVLALLDPGEKTIPMNLRRYLEPQDYENWQKIVDATGEEFLALPEIQRLGAKAPLTGGTIDKKRLSLEQRAEYQRLFWEKAKPGLERLFGSPTYKAAKDDYKRKLISRILGTARDSVHAKVLKMGG